MLIFQVSQITALPQVQAELLLRFQQLQSRLSTLKIENEEVRHTHTHTHTHTIPSPRMSTSAAAVPPLRIKNEMTDVHTFSISPFPSLVVRYYICRPALSFTAPDAVIHIVSIFSISVGVCGCLSLVVGRPAVSCSSQHVKDGAEVLMNAVLLQ